MAPYLCHVKKSQVFESNLTHSTPAPQAPPPTRDSFPAAEAKKAAVEDVDETFGDDDDVSMSDDIVVTAVDGITESEATVNNFEEVDMVDDTPIDITASLNTVNDVADSHSKKVTEGYTFDIPIRGAPSNEAKVITDRSTPFTEADGINTPRANGTNTSSANGTNKPVNDGTEKPANGGTSTSGGSGTDGTGQQNTGTSRRTWFEEIEEFSRTSPAVRYPRVPTINGKEVVFYPIVGSNKLPSFPNTGIWCDVVFVPVYLPTDWKKH